MATGPAPGTASGDHRRYGPVRFDDAAPTAGVSRRPRLALHLQRRLPRAPWLSAFSRLYRAPLPERLKLAKAFPKPYETFRFWESYLPGFSRRESPAGAGGDRSGRDRARSPRHGQGPHLPGSGPPAGQGHRLVPDGLLRAALPGRPLRRAATRSPVGGQLLGQGGLARRDQRASQLDLAVGRGRAASTSPPGRTSAGTPCSQRR